MPGHRLNQYQYALQHIVKSFGNLLFNLAEQHLTDICHVVFLYCVAENIDYLVLRYLYTGTLLYKEFSKEWLHTLEA
jgi:hypothetical protein